MSKLTPEVCAELLDPERWGEILDLFARTTGLAVALIDPSGHLLGSCHNPQPIWKIARKARPEWGGGCLFCLAPEGQCTAAAEALQSGSLVLVHDPAGFAHVALPLLLGKRHLGTLIAGQVFDRYPEPMPLERMAREFRLSRQEVWHVARQQPPMSSASLRVRGNLLSSLGHAFLRERFGLILERTLAETNKELQSSNEELEFVNSELNQKVIELDRSNSDLQNLLNSTQIATIFLNGKLCVASFTPVVGSLFQLNARDIGRPISDLAVRFGEVGLMEDISEALRTTTVRERDLIGRQGRHYLMRTLPYLTSEDEVDGVVITFVDVTDLKQANQLAESRVRTRTAQLESANQELEAFSYSVSHDLRAPLRGIDGWSHALAEDYGPQLDERANQYLNRVRSEARHLGELIDDMLKLSHVSAGELVRQVVDLTAIANQIAKTLGETHSGWCPRFKIESGLTAMGDSRWLEIALTNLLSNAAKFTGTREEGVVEFGRVNHGGEEVFYVRDNGVGFDMAYAGKLFAPFQRFHKRSEFTGNGIGLATVQRVIHRHGGRLWAEAAVDAGATFYFTLEAPNGS